MITLKQYVHKKTTKKNNTSGTRKNEKLYNVQYNTQ